MARATVTRVYTYTVVGQGIFPVDMLRYDLAYPKSEADSLMIERTHRPRTPGEHRVTLVSSKRPTLGRWASFGWDIESVE